MTLIELRMFCESLPATLHPTKGGRPHISHFAKECGVNTTQIYRLMEGKSALTDRMSGRILPVMQKYGFAGQ